MENDNYIDVMKEYQDILKEEQIKEKENSNKVLLEIKNIVNIEYFNAIEMFLKDDDNGIWGGLEIVNTPIGIWQDEAQDDSDNYWNILKGLFINQSCGISGDDYNGTLEIIISDNMFLRCCFSM